MGKIVSIIGNKGGTGKTTLSHMIAHGLGQIGMRAVALLTDTYRDKLDKEHRTYLPFDARTPAQLEQAAARLARVHEWVGVVDGGGNRPEMDHRLASMSDLVILPFRDSHEDIRTVMRDLARFPRAYALPSQWPTNRWAAACAGRAVDAMMAIHKDRILAPVFAMSASKLLLQDRIPARLPRTLDNASREIALQVLELVGVDVADALWMPVPQQHRGMFGAAGAIARAPAATPGHVLPQPSVLHA